ncbi:hypothetical protein PHIM7_19 [Sinorhizobium phage phiM7]|uniref:Uncharacterized protein n=3 Tax=Emdodecavirus TaxID=1980937 RepID=S5M6I1_9CAUD|nr:hypothetical protein AB690_gp023 [Sinorhizobium phage phiM12]YP_009212274.1 hypothetical protein AVT40_gp034 [Sinorhizobium phage phiN3]YP_009601144.1 hypothetical protein FDH46_gp019 [Sinorhizobium phage phiM7]AKF12927.1 hypothetical protein PHIM19_20 [Sinorhizobium phage phiM19]AGR47661.1 hypothetical protein SmphiM12_029 [Sinorhizobium phage phiM12]AKF12567.1 hypothetical protein PHIM7_19 [Sinorhizobium phage phiM7]AKF13299.1 hypothetical protein PHIN3_34 [Sinorhizobium phage phiN3]
MKIIGVDNYNREYCADVLICENVRNTYIGNLIVEYLNSLATTDNYYKLVEDDYRLWRGMEELI